MDQTITGTIKGNTIVLDAPSGVPDGERVEVVVRATKRKPGDGILRSAGALAPYWTPEDDQILEEIYQARKHSTRPEITDEFPR